MVFGFSWGEVALILGVSAALFGPKDIVIIGKAAGRLTGKAVGYIQSARGQINPLLQRSEINTVHKELRETMAQLEAIRHEMRTGISIMNPGPIKSQGLETAVPGLSSIGQQAGKGTNSISSSDRPIPVDYSSSSLSKPASPTQMQTLQVSTKKDEPAVPLILPSIAPVLVPRVEGLPVGLPSALEASQTHPDGRGRKTPNQEVVVLPISAVEAGLLPSSRVTRIVDYGQWSSQETVHSSISHSPPIEPIAGGADIVFASIVERKVAFQSLKFFEEGET